MADLFELLNQSCRQSFDLPWTGSAYQWADEYIDLPSYFAFQFNSELSPYLLQPFNDLINSEVEQINLCGARQTGKSLFADISIPYWVVNDPGPIIRLHQDDKPAAQFLENRLKPILQNCEKTKPMVQGRYAIRTDEVQLPHCSIRVSGHSENRLNGPSARYLIFDELHRFDKGAVAKAKAMTNAFAGRRKILICSTPGVVKDQLSDEMNKGHVFQWAWQCPKCKEHQPWYWTKEIREDAKGNKIYAGIVWKKFQHEDGSYDYERTGNSAKLICAHCEHELKDTPENRIELNRNGKFLQVKSDGDPKVHTYLWNCFVNAQISFKEKVAEYLKAYLKNKYGGNDEDIKTFHQHSLGAEWNPRAPLFKPRIFIERYDPTGTWADEAYRWMAVDYQKVQSARYYVIRAFDKKGNSRQIKYGKAFSWDDIDSIRKENKVLPQFTLVDAGYNQDEVVKECVDRGEWIEFEQDGKKFRQFHHWIALKGDQKGHYTHRADGVNQYYDEGQLAEVDGRVYPLFLWSNLGVKSIFARLRDGKGLVKWATNTIDNEYISHLFSEVKEEVEDKKTGNLVLRWVKKHDNNHYLDCECMILTGTLMAGVPLTGTEERPAELLAA